MRDLSLPDHDLVLRIRRGDAEAFDALVLRYYESLANIVHRYVQNPDIVEDVLQDVFIKLWERRATWTIPESVRAYLYTAARNAALNALRGTQTRTKVEHIEGEDLASATPPTVSDRLEQEEFAEAIQAAIETLPERGREIYILSHQHGLSYREIAEMLEISVPTVKTHMLRSIRTLEQKLRRFLTVVLMT